MPDQKRIASISQLLPKLDDDAGNFRELKQALRQTAEDEGWSEYIFDPNAATYSPSTIKEKNWEKRLRREAYKVMLNAIPVKLKPYLDAVRHGPNPSDAQALWRKIVALWSPTVRQGEWRTTTQEFLALSMKGTCSGKNVTEYGATIVKICDELSDMGHPMKVFNQQELFLTTLLDELKDHGNEVLEKVIKKDPRFETMAQVIADMEAYAGRHGMLKETYKGPKKNVSQNAAAVVKEQQDNNGRQDQVDAAVECQCITKKQIECKWGNHCFSKTCGSKHPEGHTTVKGYQLVKEKYGGPCDTCGQIWHSTANHGKPVCRGCGKAGHLERDCDPEDDTVEKVVVDKKMQNFQDVIIRPRYRQYTTRIASDLTADGIHLPTRQF